MIEYILIAASLLLVVSVLVSKISDRFGVPALLLFLLVGMLAGSDGPGGIYFDDPALARSIGVIALVLILFAGGLDTEWRSVRPVIKEGMILSTIGVLITALVVGFFACLLFDFPLIDGLLLGAIISSTDAAAVFSVLRSKGVGLKGQLRPLLELESGSNDPMAIFLTVGLIQLIAEPASSPVDLIGSFFLQMLLGAALGYGMGRVILVLVNRLRLGYEGLYPVLTVSLVFLAFGLTSVVGGNGFLAVYVAGIVVGNRVFVHKRSLLSFHDGLAWLMQIAMFLTLGLLVFPSRLVPIMGPGLLVAGFLMFVARPIAVMVGLLPSSLTWREKAFVSWIGLRGAVPIILATFPLLARIPHADLIFNVVFFVVLTSVLLQGTSIPSVARWLGLDAPTKPKRAYPIEFTPMGGLEGDLKEIPILPNAHAAGKAIVELGLPDDFLVILVARGEEFLVPSGGTVVRGGDTLLVLSGTESFRQTAARLTKKKEQTIG
jgi:potassium/hydrogen antiporter